MAFDGIHRLDGDLDPQHRVDDPRYRMAEELGNH